MFTSLIFEATIDEMKRRLGLSEILDTYSILMKYDEVQFII